MVRDLRWQAVPPPNADHPFDCRPAGPAGHRPDHPALPGCLPNGQLPRLSIKFKAEQLASELATQAQTLDDVNGLVRLLMKSALERMLDTEMDNGRASRAQSHPRAGRRGTPQRRTRRTQLALFLVAEVP